MCDFDWYGGHKDLDDWWVDVWTDCIKQYEVDGFRLDISIARPDLWERIRQNANAAGHDIAIFEENDFPIPASAILTSMRFHPGPGSRCAPCFTSAKFGKGALPGHDSVCRWEDQRGRYHGKGPLRIRLDGLSVDKVGRRDEVNRPDGISDVRLTVDKVGESPVKNIIVQDEAGNQWQLTAGRRVVVEGKPAFAADLPGDARPRLAFSMLSCHDSGWGIPATITPTRPKAAGLCSATLSCLRP